MKLVPFVGQERRAPRRNWQEEALRLEALKRWLEGWNTYEIAIYLGVSEARIYNLKLSEMARAA